jgi:hypothetical protein
MITDLAIARQQYADLLKHEAQSYRDGKADVEATPHSVTCLIDDTWGQTATYWDRDGLTWEDWAAFAPNLNALSCESLAQAISAASLIRRGYDQCRAERAIDSFRETQMEEPWHGLVIPENECGVEIGRASCRERVSMFV